MIDDACYCGGFWGTRYNQISAFWIITLCSYFRVNNRSALEKDLLILLYFSFQVYARDGGYTKPFHEWNLRIVTDVLMFKLIFYCYGKKTISYLQCGTITIKFMFTQAK